MKILFDHQIFESQTHGGISRYFYEIIKGIEQLPRDVQHSLSLIESSNEYIKNQPSIAKQIRAGSDYYHQFLGGVEFPGKWRLYKNWLKLFPQTITRNKKNTLQAIAEKGFDIFHPTDIDDYFINHIGDKPFVITIHDMIDELFPEYSFHVHSTYKTSVKEALVKKATGIIAVSESTKKDLLKRFNVKENKIKVIYHGIHAPKDDEQYPRLIHEDYFLYVGKRVHYKNFYFFLQAIQPILLKNTSIKIVCVGSPFKSLELKYFQDLRLHDKLIYFKANDFQLGSLYKYARAFVYPSLYEGFGLPVLEAFKHGCPVLLSNTSSLPEVAGDAGIYFNPKEIDSMQKAITTMLENEDARNEIVAKGYKRVQNFSWDRTVSETVDFYKSLV